MTNYWFALTTTGSNTWNPVGYVEADFNSFYDTGASGEWATLEINGAIGLYAERDFLSQYTILGSVTADFPVLYEVSGAPPVSIEVYRDFTSIYSVDSSIETIEVYQDFPVFWQAQGVVITDFSAVYQLNADTAFPGWNEVTPDEDDWSEITPTSGIWTPEPQPSTTWN